MTSVHVVLLLVVSWHCMYQGRCSVAVEMVMREVSRPHSHHWIGKWVASPFPDFHQK